MKKILLSNGEWTLVSDGDYIFLIGYNWGMTNNGYVQGWVEGKMQLMHRVIAARAKIDLTNDIDHIDGNKLNNQRNNLRAATRNQNLYNSKRYCTNTSGSKGVYRSKYCQKWRARIMINGERFHLGYYETKEQAAYAYKIAAEKYHGEFASLG